MTWKEKVEYIEAIDTVDYTDYYNGYSLLKKLDINGLQPEIFISSGNRTAGKTFFFKHFLILYFIHFHGKFLMLTRKKTQLNSAALSFIEDLQNAPDFPGFKWEVVGGEMAGVKEILVNGNCAGYYSYLNYADDIKEASNMFNSVDILMKDEFQVRTSGYVEDEIGKLRSIHRSIARKFGESVRFLPLLLVGNQLSVINPYYVTFGIHKRLQPDTKNLRGEGWVFQLTYNPTASHKAKESAFERAFGVDAQSLSDNENVYMDNLNLIRKMDTGPMMLLCNMCVKGVWYGVWSRRGGYYISQQHNLKLKRNYSLDADSHTEGCQMLKYGDPVFCHLKKYFDKGLIIFRDVECKYALFDMFVRSTLL